MIHLTPDQKHVHDAAVEFALRPRQKFLTIGGLAGTGKTTVLAQIVKAIRKETEGLRAIAFCCFTGKAASVLRSKLVAAEMLAPEEYCGTIHGLIYEPIVKQQIVIGWRRVADLPADLIVVDEASMVNETIWNDLLSYGKPIIAVGDHGQLPPIEGAFSLMAKPDFKLEKIHRQAEGNPIIRLSMLARETGEIPVGNHGEGILKISGGGPAAQTLDRVKDVRDALFLCGLNRTRQAVNQTVRARLGFTGAPQKGEKIICLKNNREELIFNGVTGILKRYAPNAGADAGAKARVEVDMETGNTFTGDVVRAQFGAEKTIKEIDGVNPKQIRELFDWGYCLTVHKAQGSEADNVVLFEERFSRMTDEDWRRWLYTAVTRARKRLLIVGRRYSPAPPKETANAT